MGHLSDPDGKVFFLTMEGEMFEVDVKTLRATRRFNLVKELNIPTGAHPHFKDGFAAGDTLIVTNNTYEEPEFIGKRQAGRLGQWDGENWFVIEDNPFVGAGGGVYPSTEGPTYMLLVGPDPRPFCEFSAGEVGPDACCQRPASASIILGTLNG